MSIYGIRNDIDDALSAATNSLEYSVGEEEEDLEELVRELTWIKCFITTSHRTEMGVEVARVWVSAIERLVHQCLHDLHVKPTADLKKSCASLREKIQPFVVTCQCHPAP
ncbi:unnamed protein product [Cuscuta campestris]|uniref:Rx N-terminal domain-containing protein n=1 Tax=Cuscuta campestris TaxID=132261 RepID=A0A484MAM6_9ASTE|nr:unnamed protein product [Cuscuta campestris]